MAALTEDLIKDLFRNEGLPVPQGAVVKDSADIDAYLHQLPQELVLKGLVPIGRRGKAGAVAFCSKEDLPRHVEDLWGKEVYGYQVHRVLVEEKIPVQQEYFLSFSFDRNRRSTVIMASEEGGVEVESIIAEKPEKMQYYYPDVSHGLFLHHAIELWSRTGIEGKQLLKMAQITLQLFKVFVNYDLSLLEINPLAVSENGEVSLVGAMAELDEDAAFRQRKVLDWAGETLKEHQWAQYTPLERQVAEANLQAEGTGTVRFREIKGGNIALLTGGAGAGLVTVDTILEYGGKPANYSDVGAGNVMERLKILLRTILGRPEIEGFLVAFSRLNLGRSDFLAKILKEILEEMEIDPRSFPVLVRLSGLGEEKAREILTQIDGLHFHGSDMTLEGAAEKIVDLVGGGKS